MLESNYSFPKEHNDVRLIQRYAFSPSRKNQKTSCSVLSRSSGFFAMSSHDVDRERSASTTIVSFHFLLQSITTFSFACFVCHNSNPKLTAILIANWIIMLPEPPMAFLHLFFDFLSFDQDSNYWISNILSNFNATIE